MVMIYPRTRLKPSQIVTTLLGALACLHLGSVPSYGQDPQPSWVSNYPSTPLQITAIGDRAFELINLGRSRIVGYQLGCVAIGEPHPSIVSTASRQSADIAVSDKLATIAMHVLQDKLKCSQENAKLSVVWVQFDDGAEWTAARAAQK